MHSKQRMAGRVVIGCDVIDNIEPENEALNYFITLIKTAILN